jgi:hypothetical protein
MPHWKTMSATKASAVASMIHFVFSRICRIMAWRLLGLLGPAFWNPSTLRGRVAPGRNGNHES